MDAKLRSYYRKQILLSFLLILPTIPYIYLLYRFSLFFLLYHGWPIYVLAYPLLWMLLMTVRGTLMYVRKKFLSGYKKISPEDDISLHGIFGTGETAHGKLTRLTRSILTRINSSANISFYVYPNSGKDKNKLHNVMVCKELGGFGLMISQETLESYRDSTLLGVLSHEISHIQTRNWYSIIDAIMGLVKIPANALILFLAVSIGFYSWWLLVPALSILGLIHMYIVGFPSKIDEISADHLTVKLGYGWGQIDFLENVPFDFTMPDGIHGSVKNRVSQLKKALDE